MSAPRVPPLLPVGMTSSPGAVTPVAAPQLRVPSHHPTGHPGDAGVLPHGTAPQPPQLRSVVLPQQQQQQPQHHQRATVPSSGGPPPRQAPPIQLPPLPPQVAERFILGSAIGRGSFGIVLQVQGRVAPYAGHSYAMKVLDLRLVQQTDGARERLTNEMDAIRRIPPHRNVSGLVMEMACAESMCTLHPLCTGGDAQRLMRAHMRRGLPERMVRGIIHDVLHGLAHMHAAGYAHRDVKPDNILLETLPSAFDLEDSVDARGTPLQQLPPNSLMHASNIARRHDAAESLLRRAQALMASAATAVANGRAAAATNTTTVTCGAGPPVAPQPGGDALDETPPTLGAAALCGSSSGGGGSGALCRESLAELQACLAEVDTLAHEAHAFLTSEPLPPRAVLSDFSFTARHTNNDLNQPHGTPYYIAPEILETCLYQHRRFYTHTCDVWSLAVTAFTLLCGVVPFDAPDKPQLFQSIQSQTVHLQSRCWRTISDDAKQFLYHMFVRPAEQRPTAARALEHPWIRGHAALLQDHRGVRDVLHRMRALRPPLLEVTAAVEAQLATQQQAQQVPELPRLSSGDVLGSFSRSARARASGDANPVGAGIHAVSSARARAQVATQAMDAAPGSPTAAAAAAAAVATNDATAMTLQIFLDAYITACARANTPPLQSLLRWTTVRLAPGPIAGPSTTSQSHGLASPGGASGSSSVGSQQLVNTRGQLTPITDRDFVRPMAVPLPAVPDHAMPTPVGSGELGLAGPAVPGTPGFGTPSAARFLQHSQSYSPQSPQSPQSPSAGAGTAVGAGQVGVITIDLSTDLAQGTVREQDVHVLGDAIASTLAPFTGVGGTSLRRMGRGINTSQLPAGMVAEIVAVPARAADSAAPRVQHVEGTPLLLSSLYRMLAAPESPVFSITAPARLMPPEYTAAMAANPSLSAFAFNPIESGASPAARHHAVALLRAARPQSFVSVAMSTETPVTGVALSAPSPDLMTAKSSSSAVVDGDAWVMRKNMLVQALPQLHACLAVPDDLR